MPRPRIEIPTERLIKGLVKIGWDNRYNPELVKSEFGCSVPTLYKRMDEHVVTRYDIFRERRKQREERERDFAATNLDFSQQWALRILRGFLILNFWKAVDTQLELGVAELRFGLIDNQPRTYRQVSEELNLSVAEVKQLEGRVLTRLIACYQRGDWFSVNWVALWPMVKLLKLEQAALEETAKLNQEKKR